MSDEDLERILRHPATMIAIGRRGADLRPRESASAQLRHVRARARRLRAREEGDDAGGRGAEDVVVSGGAARAADRGVLRPGHEGGHRGVRSRRASATPQRSKSPHQYAEGFSYVIVNGQVVFEKGAMTASRPGRVLYGPGKSRWLYLTCLLDELRHLEHVDGALPPNTAFSASSALIIRLFFLSCSPFFLM